MVIIQLLKDTKYPANYQIIIDSSLGNYAVLRDFFSALQTGRDVAESHREDAAGRETPLQAGRGKIAEMLQVNNLRYASTPF